LFVDRGWKAEINYYIAGGGVIPPVGGWILSTNILLGEWPVPKITDCPVGRGNDTTSLPTSL
jgi:hypothetical protein